MKHNNSFRCFGKVLNIEKIDDILCFDILIIEDLRIQCQSGGDSLLTENTEYDFVGHFEDINGHTCFRGE